MQAITVTDVSVPSSLISSTDIYTVNTVTAIGESSSSRWFGVKD